MYVQSGQTERVLNFILTVCWWAILLTKTNHSLCLIFTSSADYFYMHIFDALSDVFTLFTANHGYNDQNSFIHALFYVIAYSGFVSMKLNIDWSFALIT